MYVSNSTAQSSSLIQREINEAIALKRKREKSIARSLEVVKFSDMLDPNSIKKLNVASTSGNIQYYLGNFYVEQKKPVKAFKCFEKAANIGHEKAQYELGLSYQEGYGCTQNTNTAINLFTDSANKGYAKSQFQLGGLYHDGKLVTRDDKESVKWYDKAAKQGHLDSQYNLAYMIINGYGCDVTPYTLNYAICINSEAAQAGNANALFMIGQIYLEINEIETDICKKINNAFRSEYCFKIAADKGHPQAKEILDQIN